MARAQTKEELQEAAITTYHKLLQLIDSMTEEERNSPFDFSQDEKKKEAHWKRDKNLRDVIMHLHEWHNLLLYWLENNKAGIRKPFLIEGYNWKTYGDMNQQFWKNCQKVSLPDAMERLQNSHQEIMKVMESMTNEELFTKSIYDWVGDSSIGSYFTSATSSHYDWAIKKMKAHIKKVKSYQDKT